MTDPAGLAPPPHPPYPSPAGNTVAVRTLVRYAERAMERSSDAAQARGNTARLLVNGTQAFPAWLDAIQNAQHWVHLENYVLRDDRTGRAFREALCDRARDGVKVRVLYDWMGCWATPRRYFKPFRDAGVEVRAFAPPRAANPLAFMRRDHRKVVAVDGLYGSVAGMCIGDEWAGDPGRGIPAWRDTGAEFRGPVAAALDVAFSRTWALTGAPLPPDEVPDPRRAKPVGDVSVRVVEGEPAKSRIYRLSQFLTLAVEERLWITDPYFLVPPAMSEALASAARGGVDVRVLLPAFNNWPIVGGMSRAGYRPLLEAGVRIFEWEGPMIHAKTAVADGIWTRVGSSNQNLASLMGNWELDVAVTDRHFARAMEDLFEDDLGSAVEIGLLSSGVSRSPYRERRGAERTVVEAPGEEHKPGRARAREARARSYRGTELGRLLGRLARAGSVLVRALIGERAIGREDVGWIMIFALLLFLVSVVGFLHPRWLAWPMAFFVFWMGVAALVRLMAGREPPPDEGAALLGPDPALAGKGEGTAPNEAGPLSHDRRA
ncbi:MAG TPA: phospholipase D-like domain-containing protein [Longimicrobium sp.]|nr:phospholipase D-like domain-containing protein [Longimicrobium sp.]